MSNTYLEKRAETSGYLRLKDLLEVLPVSKSTIYSWLAHGKFVKPLKLGARITVWSVAEVMAWIESEGELKR